MAYPPATLPINRTNATVQQDLHAADHNGANGAINDIVAELGTNPSGTDATVMARLAAVEAAAALHGCKWIVSGQTLAGAATVTTLKPTTITVDTGGFMPNVNNDFVTIPDDDVYAVSVHVTSQTVFSAGAKITISTGGQGIIGSATTETGYNVLGCSAVTNFTPGDTFKFNVTNYGSAVTVAAAASIYRVSMF